MSLATVHLSSPRQSRCTSATPAQAADAPESGRPPTRDTPAVLDAYGFDPQADVLAQLLALNLDVAARIDKGQPVTAPGVPLSFGDPAELITDDCIQP